MNECGLNIRYGFRELFKNCFRNNVPFYVVSGGIDIFIGSLLNSILDINTYRNFFLFANKFIFNRREKLVDV
jgi:2-hydroxy-3-keto-5-methylthiopentenyl-1-phosphate phosphatase